MARPQTNPKQKLAGYQLYKVLGTKPQAIWEELKAAYSDHVSIRTVNSWLADWKRLETSLDDSFEWVRMDEYGLPWEASNYLLDMLPKAIKRRLAWNGPIPGIYPTVREVSWWWRIHLAIPEINWFDVHFIAEAFAYREIARDVLGRDVGMDDLEAFIIWKPWLDEERRVDYEAMVESEAVAPLHWENTTGDLQHLENDVILVVGFAWITGGRWPDQSNPYQLPSEYYPWKPVVHMKIDEETGQPVEKTEISVQPLFRTPARGRGQPNSER